MVLRYQPSDDRTAVINVDSFHKNQKFALQPYFGAGSGGLAFGIKREAYHEQRRYPVPGEQHAAHEESAGKFSVSCAVSMRWLRFQETTGLVNPNSEAVVVDVMTDSDFDGSPSKSSANLS